MSIHVYKCIHKGGDEYHLRYPGMTEAAAQELADRINGGWLRNPNEIASLLADAERYRWLRNVGDDTWRPFALRDGCNAEMVDAAIDAAIDAARNATK